MKNALRGLVIGIAVTAASPASAADWWLVSGVPTDPVAVFADVESLALNDNNVEIRVLRIDRVGRTIETVQQMRCDRDSGSAEGEDVRQFACASEQERDQHGLILAAMSPALVARMIFAIDITAGDQRGAEPRSYAAWLGSAYPTVACAIGRSSESCHSRTSTVASRA